VPGVRRLEPWITTLRNGDLDSAWDQFLARYRRLLFATIGHLAHDEDEVMDAFVHVCDSLRIGGMARLRRYIDEPVHRARFSTWLVTVVRNLTVDWLRQRIGRRQSSIPAELSPLQQQIYLRVFLEGRSHRETYEVICARGDAVPTFREYLREVSATYRAVHDRPAPVPMREPTAGLPPDDELPDPASATADPAAEADRTERLATVLADLAPDERLALQLFIVDELPAAEVARLVAWPNAKTVYNRVYRCLAALRASFARAGIGRRDL
jgi:RNA polymerase sigma factor (sigma-70 family)